MVSFCNRQFVRVPQKNNIGFQNLEVTKLLIDKALKEKSVSTLVVDVKSQKFRDEINKRALVKNLKQKTSFIIGSIPMFKTLQDIIRRLSSCSTNDPSIDFSDSLQCLDSCKI